MSRLAGATLVFDLDGTLVDTAPDLVAAANHVLAREGLAPVPEATLRPQISFGSRQILATAFASHGRPTDPAALDRHLAVFLAHYEANIAVTSRPFPSAVEALDALAASGARLAVCTNKMEHLALRLLDELALRSRFDFVAGRNTFAVCKPHPDHLLATIARAGGEALRAVMIGDSDVDVATARAAGLPVVGVSFGYTEVAMADLAPDALIGHYDELAEAVARLLPPPA